MERYIRFVVRRRRWALGLVLIVTGLAGAQLTQSRVATSLSAMFLGENPEYVRYKERVADFGGDGFIAIGLENVDLFADETIRRLQEAVAAMEAHPEVDRVQSVLDAGRLDGDGNRLEVSRTLQAILDHPERRDELARELLADEDVVGSVVSSDGHHTAFVVQLVFNETRAVEDQPRIIADLTRELTERGFAAQHIHLAGLIPVFAQVIDQTFYNLTKLTPFVLVVLLLVVFAMFRRLWPVFITGGVGAVAVIWTMGFSVLLESRISVLVAMVPAVVMIISFSDVIHLCSAYLLELNHDEGKEEAILRAGVDVGKACVFTSLTTFAGFLSLSLIPAPVFRLLGVVLGFGVAVALLLAMTLAPILFSLMPRPRPWRRGSTARVQDLLDGVLAGAQRLATGRPWWTVALFVVVAVVSLLGIQRIVIDTDFAGRMADDNPVRLDQRYFEEHFHGTATLELYARTSTPGGILEADFYRAVRAWEKEVESRPDVDRVVSLVDVIDRVHQELAGTTEPPDSRALLAQYMLLLEMSPDDFPLDRLVDFDRRTLRLLVRIREQGVRQTFAAGQEALDLGGPVRATGAEVSGTGSMFLMGQWLSEIIRGQRNGLLAAFLSVALMMMIGLWSWRAGLWSMIPNLLPLLVLGGTVGWFWETVDSDVMAIAMIAVGIGVDDTIHFLMRYKLESARCASRGEALSNTFHFSGRAIVITSVVLVLGFAPFATSDYLPLHMMGTLLPLCLVVALLADLLLVPALAALGAIRFARPDKTGERP